MSNSLEGAVYAIVISEAKICWREYQIKTLKLSDSAGWEGTHELIVYPPNMWSPTSGRLRKKRPSRFTGSSVRTVTVFSHRPWLWELPKKGLCQSLPHFKSIDRKQRHTNLGAVLRLLPIVRAFCPVHWMPKCCCER